MENEVKTDGKSDGKTHHFRVWAPEKDRMILHIMEPHEARFEMQRVQPLDAPQDSGHGSGTVPPVEDVSGSPYFSLDVHDVRPGTRYAYTLEDGNDYPDPASHFQPEGVHGPSEVVDHAAFTWKHPAGPRRPFGEWVIYELHVGTFTSEGTFAGVISRLDDLAGLGINAIELMPVNQFPGTRNWGYDGVFPYAVQNSYGGPAGLKELVDACHARDIAVVLDVVYNHWGPEGAYAHRFGPYTTDSYRTPWGEAINLDGPWSDGVRAFVIENIRHWFEHYHVDALRVDAVHAIYDHGARNFWGEVREAIDRWRHEWNRPLLLIAESDLNSPRVLQSPQVNGFGFDAQWLDDFHHVLYVLVHPEGRRHYADFEGLRQLAKALTEGFVHSGEFVRFRRRRHGASSAGIPGDRFVVFSQNHDQVGNRAGGERLSLLVDTERLKLAAATLLLSPCVPLLFMGEEYGENAPFHFFTDYQDPELAQAVRDGRAREFAEFNWGDIEPADPGALETFHASRLRWDMRNEGVHGVILQWYRDLLAFRRSCRAMNAYSRDLISVEVVEDRGLVMRRRAGALALANTTGVSGNAESLEGHEMVAVFNFSEEDLVASLPSGHGWRRRLDSRAVGATLVDASENDRVVVAPWSVVVLTAA